MRPICFAMARIVLAVLCLGMMLPTALRAAAIGTVIAVTPGAFVLRGGATESLALHAGIRVSDSISTDAGGRVKILFSDDSSLSLGPNTTLEMNEYADAGSASAFGVHVPQGLVRAITGSITENNPEGFRISTPEAVVGIRGTILSLRTGNGLTTVYVENSLRQVHVNGIHVPSGNKITLPGDPPRPGPIRPEDRRTIGRELAVRGGSGAAAAAPEPAQGGGGPKESPLFAAAADLVPPDTPLAAIALGTQTLGDSLLASRPLTGRVSGMLGPASMYTSTPLVSGDFGFDVNLSTGDISNGYLNFITEFTASDDVMVFDTGMAMAVTHRVNPGDSIKGTLSGSGVIGSANPSGFLMHVYGPVGLEQGGVVIFFTPLGHGKIFGTDDLRAMSSGDPVSVGFGVDEGFYLIEDGTGSGAITMP